jgi:hypothetical protein
LKIVAWKFLSISITALIGLSLTGVVPWAAPQCRGNFNVSS